MHHLMFNVDNLTYYLGKFEKPPLASRTQVCNFWFNEIRQILIEIILENYFIVWKSYTSILAYI